MEPILSLYNCNFMSNLELLHKSKEDSQINAALCRARNRSRNSFDYNLDSEVPGNLELDNKDSLNILQEYFSTETLIVVYYSVAISWYNKIPPRRAAARWNGKASGTRARNDSCVGCVNGRVNNLTPYSYRHAQCIQWPLTLKPSTHIVHHATAPSWWPHISGPDFLLPTSLPFFLLYWARFRASACEARVTSFWVCAYVFLVLILVC